ncbi:hypothetical protein DENSPDRAFT_838210 [Dentipellis sp. KUC8613]|nr:hypothetical protein DENSPDRAFT_838210 [Dentipellis sp. KUC8613]
MSMLRRLWQTLRRPTGFVGKDLEGNKYYEYASSTDDPRRTKRRVKYKNYEDVWSYVSGSRRIPVQWTSWLTHTRHHPPSLEELRLDAARQRRVLANAAAIDARVQEERAAIASGNATPTSDINTSISNPSSSAEGPTSMSPTVLEPQTNQNLLPQFATPRRGSKLPAVNKDKDWQPEAWSPRPTQKRGG